MKTRNSLTVDLEFCWCSEFVKGVCYDEGSIKEDTRSLLGLLDKHDVKATFFVLGIVAERCPGLVKEVKERGHEIASHSYSHNSLFRLSKKEVEEEIVKSIRAIKIVAKERPIGFRAPNFSLNNKNSWVLDILEKRGFKYDSSIFPINPIFSGGMYGIKGAPLYPYIPSKDDIRKECDRGIMEFPVNTMDLNVMRLPAGGGFFFRALPYSVIRKSIINNNKAGIPSILYIHLKDVYKQNGVGGMEKAITRLGLSSSAKKLERVFREFEFQPVKDLLG